MHLPLILKPSGKGKLSKRDGDKEGFPVYPLKWDKDTQGFKELGFLPSSLVNYLALLGWNDGTENEIFTLSELEKKFSISGIQKGGARFDYEKAKWLNHKYISNIKTRDLVNKNIIKHELDGYPNEKQEEIVELVKQRLYTLNDFKKEVSFLKDPKSFDEKVVEKLKVKNPLPILNKIHFLVKDNHEGFNIKTFLFEWAKSENIPLGHIMQSLRLCLIGDLTGPDLFAVCSILGKDVILKRVKKFINHIK
jgi:glutamyl-tRNA synthetase